jgi:predicted branched-subunit amino acid permease
MEAKFLERDLEVKSNRMEWFEGVKDGIPLALGYIAVAFTFGIAAFQAGLSVFQSSVISATNFTSAGQFAGVTLIVSTATLFEVALTQFIINARYFLMSAALSQKN